MTTLEVIKSKLDSKKGEFITTLSQFTTNSVTELEVEVLSESLTFFITDQVDTDGYYVISEFYGRDSDTNAPISEREFTARTIAGVVRIVNRQVKSYADYYAE